MKSNLLNNHVPFFQNYLNQLKLSIELHQPLSSPTPTKTLELYQFWKENWIETFHKDLLVDIAVYSDDFIKQDKILSLSLGQIYQACVFFRTISAENIIHFEESYFKAWDEESIKCIKNKKSPLLICSQLTLAPELRGHTPVKNFKWKDFMSACSIKYFIETGSPYMIATVRNNKGMNDASIRLGAKVLKKSSQLYNVEVDLLIFDRDDIYLNYKNHPYASIIDEMWEHDINHSNIIKFEKKSA